MPIFVLPNFQGNKTKQDMTINAYAPCPYLCPCACVSCCASPPSVPLCRGGESLSVHGGPCLCCLISSCPWKLGLSPSTQIVIFSGPYPFPSPCLVLYPYPVLCPCLFPCPCPVPCLCLAPDPCPAPSPLIVTGVYCACCACALVPSHDADALSRSPALVKSHPYPWGS